MTQPKRQQVSVEDVETSPRSERFRELWRLRKEVAMATDTVDLLRRMFDAFEDRPCLGAETASGAFEWRSFGAVYDHAKKVN